MTHLPLRLPAAATDEVKAKLRDLGQAGREACTTIAAAAKRAASGKDEGGAS